MLNSSAKVQCHGAAMLPDILLDMPEGRNTLQGQPLRRRQQAMADGRRRPAS